ncbi:MAG: aldo/keto reductase [Salinarimonadaceae bacterium]|nr:MAG: aldo/keto reductase [Salinarimonadaceae bacterium]
MAEAVKIPYRRLGRSGLVVSRLCLGTMMFGDQTDEREAAAILDAARAVGVNFIDTADVYAKGRSEKVVGRMVAADRDDWVLATKVANPNGKGPNRRGASRKWLLEAVPRSLQRLETDYIDILYLHKEDLGTPVEETVRALADLLARGQIRYFGLSNHRAWKIAEFVHHCRMAGIDGPIVCQPLYHILNRSIETEVLPVCAAHGIGVVSYSPLARGVLTGKYAGGVLDPDSRAGRGDRRILQTEFEPTAIAIADHVAQHARSRGTTPATLAIAWALANPHVTGVIAGPKSLSQWEGYVEAVGFTTNETDESVIDSLVKPGCTAIAQFVDPNYPAHGRKPSAGGHSNENISWT